MRYAVDSERQAMVATGIVAPVMVWEEIGGKRRPSETEQERDPDTGMPLWQVEVMYRQSAFGRETTATAMVKCGSVEAPQVGEFTTVRFSDLAVEVRVNRSGGVSEFWSAGEVNSDGASKNPAASRQTGAKSDEGKAA